jgi:hypothetical protein
MARGWESKSVESQQEMAAAVVRAPAPAGRSPEEIERERKRDNLLLSRTRVTHDLETACNARYRQQLIEALAFLDAELAKLAIPRGISASGAK